MKRRSGGESGNPSQTDEGIDDQCDPHLSFVGDAWIPEHRQPVMVRVVQDG